MVINLRLAQALGRSSRVAGSHDSGGDGEGSGVGRPGELGDGLTKHLDCVDGCKEGGVVWGRGLAGREGVTSVAEGLTELQLAAWGRV